MYGSVEKDAVAYESWTPVKLLGQQDRVMRRWTIHFYKVQWRRHSEEEATWETKDFLHSNYPNFLPL
jgi:hypothetical protein